LFVGLFGNPGHTLASAGFHPAQILLAKKTKKDFYSTKKEELYWLVVPRPNAVHVSKKR
jgi:hypothetical protein